MAKLSNNPNKIKATQYMRNVGKSFGYAFAESFRAANPTVDAMFKQTKEYSTNLYHGIKDFKSNFAEFTSTGIGKDIKDVTQEGFSNILSDLKSGKWYNKERSDQSSLDALGIDLDFGLDDFGDFDFDFDENKIEEIGHEDKVTEASTKATINAMDAVGQKTSAAIGAASVHSANYIVKANRANTSALFKLNSEGFSTVASGIAAVNSNIGILVEMGKPLTEHMQNSSLFYAKSTEYQEKSLKLLEQIAANTAPASTSDSRSGSNKKITLMDLVSSDGTLNMSTVKKLGKNAIDSSTLGIIVGMAGMFGGVKNTGKIIASNPIGLLMESMFTRIFDTKGKKHTNRSSLDAMSNFDEVLANLLPGLLAKTKATTASKTNLPPFMKELLRALQGVIPSSGVSRNMNVANYEKGKVDWDGMSRKALMDVIPTQLGKILAAITGEDEERFDYKTGKWIKTKDIKTASKKQLAEASNKATGNLFADARKSVQKSSIGNLSKRDKQIYDEQIQAFINELFLNDNEDYMKFINPNEEFDYKKYKKIASQSTLKDFRKRVQTLAGRNAKYTSSFASNMYNERSRYGSEMNNVDSGNINESVHNRSLEFGKNTAGNSILKITDDLGYSIFDYLQGIYSNTEYFANNFEHLIPGARIGNIAEGSADAQSISLVPKAKPKKKTTKNSNQTSKAPTKYIRNISRVSKISDNILNSELDLVTDDDNNEEYKGFSKEQKEALIKAKTDPKYKMPEEMRKSIEDRKEFLANINSKKEAISGKFAKLKNNKHIANLADLTGTTTDAIIDILDGTSEKINDFIYGTGTGKSKSLSDIMRTSVSGIFGSFTKTISDLIPNFLKDWGRSISDALGLREKWNDFKRGTGRAIRDFFFGNNKTSDPERMGPDDEGYYDDIDFYEYASNGAWEDSASAMGSGIKAFYRKTSNAVYNAKARNLRGWNKGSYNYSNGTIAYNSGFSAGATRSSRRRERRSAKKAAKKASKEEAAAAAPSIEEMAAEKIADKVTENLDLDKKDDEKTVRKSIKNIIKDMGGDTKYAMGAGAAIGGGLSLVAGVGLGPIAAAAVGAGIGFISKSKTAQKLLFGDFEDEYDKDGNKTGRKTDVRKGGVIPKKLSNFLEKNAPGMFKSGTIGAAAGLLIGSPVAGAIVGSAIGYVKSSESARKFLFGGTDENGEFKEGLIKKKTQEYIKKKVPKIGVGALAGMLAGPFGSPIANILIGSAVGILADTEKFKDWMFGKKDKEGNRDKSKGFTGFLQKTLFNPIVDIFKNLASGINQTIKSTFHNMGKAIRNFILKKLGGKIKKHPIVRGLAKGAKAIGKGLYYGITAPVRGVSNAIRKYNIRHGKIAYRNGEVMDVNARNQYRDEHMWFQGNKIMDHFDNDILADMVNIDESEYTDAEGNIDQRKLANARQSRADKLAQMQDYLNYLQDPTKKFDNDLINQRNDVRSLFKDITDNKNAKEANKIGKIYNKYLNKGYLPEKNFDKVMEEIEALNGQGVAPATIQELQSRIAKLREISYNREQAKGFASEGKTDMLMNMNPNDTLGEYLKPLENRKISDTQLGRMKDYLQIEQDKLKREMESAEQNLDINKENADNTHKILEVTNRNANTFDRMLKVLESMKAGIDKLNSTANSVKSSAGFDINNYDDTLIDQYADDQRYDELQDFMAGDASGSGLRKFRRKMFGIGGSGFSAILSAIGKGAVTAGKAIGKGALVAGKAIGKGAIKAGKAIGRGIKKLGKHAIRRGKGAVNSFTRRIGFGNVFNMNPSDPGEGTFTKDQYGNDVINQGSTVARAQQEQQEIMTEGFASMSTSVMLLENIQLLLEKIAGNVPGGGGTGGGGQDSGGLLGTLGNLLTGGGLSKAAGGLIKGLALPAAGAALMGAAYSGKLDNAYTALGGSENLSDKVKAGTVRGAVLGAAKKVTGNKLISTGGTAKTLGKIADQTANSKLGKIFKGLFDKLFAAIKKSKLGQLVGNGLDKAKDKILDILMQKTKAASKEAVQEGLKSAAKVAGIAIAVATIIWDFEEGYNNASATWKVGNPTTGQKIGAGVIHAIINFIPFISIFLPESLLIDIWANFILPIIDKEAADNLGDQRKAAEQELADYNAQHGTNLTWAQYTKQVKGNYTWGEKISNGFKNLFKRNKNTEDTTAAAAGSGLLPTYSMFGIGAGKSSASSSNSSENESGIYSLFKEIRDEMYNNSTLVAASLASSGATDFIDKSSLTGKSANSLAYNVKKFGSKALALLSAENEDEAPRSLFGRIVRGVKGWFKKDETSAGASGMVSQRDPRYAGMSMGGRSVGDMGCGPASAINALNALGKKSSMSSAVNLASRYQTTGGTDLAYFRDEFSRNGVNSSYVSGGSMIDAVASGTPTVLMGRDPFNTSKSRSPFGPNNHYVVANGIDRNGNINISDPELRTTRSYDPSILASVNAGVAATGSGMRMRFRGRRRSYYGVGAGDSGDTKFAIWRYLHENGFNDYAAAGLMGCWECESGNNPRRIEADFIGKFPGYDKVMVSNESLDNYTVNILFPAYGSKKINKSAYVGTDGHYYPGIGLAQWTGPRGYNIIQYAKEKGTGWDDLQTQLEFAIFGNGEFKSRSGGKLIEEMNQAGSIEKATELAFTKYEGCRMSNTTGYNKRLNAAKIFYNMYSGQTYYGGVFDGIQSSNSTFKTSSSSSGSSILDKIRDAFANAFSGLFGNKSSTSSTVSNSNAIYSGSDAIGDKVNNFPYYNQLENPWAPVQYSSRNDPSQTIKSSGCGPTSMSMVLKSFGQNVTPASIAQLSASRGHRTANSGTAWSMFKDIADLAQVNSTQFSSTEDAKNYLRKGYPVIASFGPGDFTKGGHYVVLSGIQGDNFYVNDPASRSRSSKLWPVNKLSQSRQFWAFSKDGKGTLYAGDSANADHYGAGRSGLLYRASGAGNRILLDNSGRFSAGASIINSDLGISSGGTLFTGEKQNQYKSQSRNAYSGMSKETAILLKTIIALATSLVENTSKISSIYDLVKEICEKSGNSQLGAIAQKMNNTSTINNNQNTLNSLNDLRDMVDSILA